MRGLKKCGHLRLCLEKKWQSARCKNGMKFESGRCSKTETCDNKGLFNSKNNKLNIPDDSKSKEKLEDKTDLCQDGQSKRHPYSCNKVREFYLLVKKSCSSTWHATMAFSRNASAHMALSLIRRSALLMILNVWKVLLNFSVKTQLLVTKKCLFAFK